MSLRKAVVLEIVLFRRIVYIMGKRSQVVLSGIVAVIAGLGIGTRNTNQYSAALFSDQEKKGRVNSKESWGGKVIALTSMLF